MTQLVCLLFAENQRIWVDLWKKFFVFQGLLVIYGSKRKIVETKNVPRIIYNENDYIQFSRKVEI